MKEKGDRKDMVAAKKMFTMPHLECKKCSYEWTPRSEKRPGVCPRCKNPGWDKDTEEVDLTDLTPRELQGLRLFLKFRKLAAPERYAALLRTLRTEVSLASKEQMEEGE